MTNYPEGGQRGHDRKGSKNNCVVCVNEVTDFLIHIFQPESMQSQKSVQLRIQTQARDY